MKDLLSRIGQWTEKMWRSIPIHLRDAIFTALLLGIAAAICFVLRSIDENGSFTLLIFVLAVVIISRFTEGYFWGVFSSLFGVICVNFVFTYPFWAFNFRHPCPSLVKGEVLSPAKIQATTGGIATPNLSIPHSHFPDKVIKHPSATYICTKKRKQVTLW